MPYPSQIDLDAVIDTARRLVEAGGIDHLSLGRVAGELGVKAPSLYGHVSGKDDLLRMVNTRTVALLFEAIDQALSAAPVEPAARLLAVARAYRAFAHTNPHTYILAMTDPAPARQPDPDYLVRLVLPLQRLMADISGEESSLAALRGMLAVIHGFVMLELAGQLRRGGDLGAAFEQCVAAQIRGWAAP